MTRSGTAITTNRARSTTAQTTVPSAEVEKGIDLALRVVGGGLGIDRTHIIVFSEDRRHYTLSHQWCAEGVAAGHQVGLPGRSCSGT